VNFTIILRLQEADERFLGIGNNAFLFNDRREILVCKVVIQFETSNYCWSDVEHEQVNLVGDPRARIPLWLVSEKLHSRFVPLAD